MPSLSSKILVEILCDNPRSRNTIEFAIQRHGKGKMDVGQSAHSHLAVVDYEGVNSRDGLLRYHQRYPQRPVVLLMASSIDRDSLGEGLADLEAEVVIKPLSVENLIQAIEKCAARPARREPTKAAMATGATTATAAPSTDNEATLPLPGGFMGAAAQPAAAPNPATEASRTVARRTTTAYMRVSGSGSPEAKNGLAGSGRNIDLNDPAAVDKARVRAGDLLLGRLKEALRQTDGTDVALLAELGTQPAFRFLPAENRVAVLVAQETLAQLALQPLTEGQFTLRTDHSPPATSEYAAAMSIEALLWRLALLTYRGMIPEDTDPLAPVYLARWPNMTRLDPIPDSLRIAALWDRKPVDPGHTARVLAVPQKHVFQFYAAAMTIGLVGPERRASSYLFKPDSPQSVAPQTLLTHLSQYLSQGGGASAKEQK